MFLISKIGFKYTCPFCRFHAKGLYPIGEDNPVIIKKNIIGAGRRNAGCYKCGSIDRDRLVYTFLNFELKIFKNEELSILHFAPEQLISKEFCKKKTFNYIMADFFAEGQHREYDDSVIHMDVQNIAFPGNHFDLVICNHVLEHVPDDRKAMQEIFRVLKVGGLAILQVPISANSNKTIEDRTICGNESREKFFGQKDHLRLYGQDYTQRLESVGFSVTRKNISKQYSKFGLNPKEDLFICQKVQR